MPESVPQARAFVDGHLRGLGVSDECCGAVKIALTEAVDNVVVHAYRDRLEPGEFEVELGPDGELIHLVVRDEGIGARPDPDGEGIGMGFRLIAAVTDELAVDGGRDRDVCVRMAFRLS